jgi:hypothetical protein
MSPDKEAKKGNAEKSEFPDPGKEPREVFATALAIVGDLFRSNDLVIELDVDGKVDVSIDNSKLEAIPTDKFQHGLTSEHFTILLRTEIDSLVHAATYLDPTEGLREGIPSDALKEVGIEEFLWRLHEVEKSLVSGELKERALLRRTTNGLIMKDINWQISVKKHDKAKGNVPDIPYACVSITYDLAQSNVPSLRLGAKGMIFELPVLRDPKQLTLELHQSDVDQMIKTLTDLRNNLDKIKRSR